MVVAVVVVVVGVAAAVAADDDGCAAAYDNRPDVRALYTSARCRATPSRVCLVRLVTKCLAGTAIQMPMMDNQHLSCHPSLLSCSDLFARISSALQSNRTMVVVFVAPPLLTAI